MALLPPALMDAPAHPVDLSVVEAIKSMSPEDMGGSNALDTFDLLWWIYQDLTTPELHEVMVGQLAGLLYGRWLEKESLSKKQTVHCLLEGFIGFRLRSLAAHDAWTNGYVVAHLLKFCHVLDHLMKSNWMNHEELWGYANQGDWRKMMQLRERLQQIYVRRTSIQTHWNLSRSQAVEAQSHSHGHQSDDVKAPWTDYQANQSNPQGSW